MCIHGSRFYNQVKENTVITYIHSKCLDVIFDFLSVANSHSDCSMCSIFFILGSTFIVVVVVSDFCNYTELQKKLVSPFVFFTGVAELKTRTIPSLFLLFGANFKYQVQPQPFLPGLTKRV